MTTDNLLDHQYCPSEWIVRSIENGKDVVTNFLELGSNVRLKVMTEYACDLDVEYANSQRTKLDIYYPEKTKSKENDVLIFIHGGFWQVASKEEYGFLAAQLKTLDCILVFLGYDLAPHKSMDGIVGQVKTAVDFTAKMFPDSRLFLMGHSAGAHLSAMMMSMEWDISLKNRLTGICLVSGLFDLLPVLSTSESKALKMDKEIASRNSPTMLISSGKLTLPRRILVIVAEHDPPEFRRQSKEYCELLKQKMPNVAFVDVPGVDHFDIFEKFVEDDFCLTKEICDFVKKDSPWQVKNNK